MTKKFHCKISPGMKWQSQKWSCKSQNNILGELDWPINCSISKLPILTFPKGASSTPTIHVVPRKPVLKMDRILHTKDFLMLLHVYRLHAKNSYYNMILGCRIKVKTWVTLALFLGDILWTHSPLLWKEVLIYLFNNI